MLRDLLLSCGHAEDETFMTVVVAEETEPEPIYQDPFDDVFGSAPTSPSREHGDAQVDVAAVNSEGSLGHLLLHPSDIPRLRSIHVTSGYREGIAASKEQHMQEGFDEGYSLGAELGLKAGGCLGALDGLCRAFPAHSTPSTQGVINGANDRDHLCKVREEVHQLRQQAEADLTLASLCGSTYFGEDGIWLYEVIELHHEPTFEQIAAAHPLLLRWNHETARLSQQLGLALDDVVEGNGTI
ncbi:hypothetical protein BAUCODRAFT_414628 [Baudoinia panamericana UAMH 10762]|uniref:Protein YAE1 n=1 Tax=Baudoinia panamericana (strain UAMH 10762) TaxID=717646 RepID=M2MNA2_BAUPA|nr:uncharacterized protein BAUCODRAFT_414628 [Baudoinia panamericana UAMH 10762]EMC98161.1 hypothetical protein BAUCODRAFT_414628 [Baudoinia panamericana UAMH 10762]